MNAAPQSGFDWWVVVSVIGALVAVCGFFIAFWIRRVEASLAALHESIGRLYDHTEERYVTKAECERTHLLAQPQHRSLGAAAARGKDGGDG